MAENKQIDLSLGSIWQKFAGEDTFVKSLEMAVRDAVAVAIHTAMETDLSPEADARLEYDDVLNHKEMKNISVRRVPSALEGADKDAVEIQYSGGNQAISEAIESLDSGTLKKYTQSILVDSVIASRGEPTLDA